MMDATKIMRYGAALVVLHDYTHPPRQLPYLHVLPFLRHAPPPAAVKHITSGAAPLCILGVTFENRLRG